MSKTNAIGVALLLLMVTWLYNNISPGVFKMLLCIICFILGYFLDRIAHGKRAKEYWNRIIKRDVKTDASKEKKDEPKEPVGKDKDNSSTPSI